jgi:alpha-glucosidase
LLVVPLTSLEKTKKVFFPKGKWYNLFSDKQISGNQELIMEWPTYQIPIFVKASSIIPMQRSVQSTRENQGDTLFVHIYNGENHNSFEWYEDDGSTMNYLREDYCLRKIDFEPQEKQIRFERQEGKYKPSFRLIKLVLHGFPPDANNFLINGKSLTINRIRIPVLDPLEQLSSIYDPNYLQSLRAQQNIPEQLIVTVPYAESEFVVRW